jgi:hypothetical protein
VHQPRGNAIDGEMSAAIHLCCSRGRVDALPSIDLSCVEEIVLVLEYPLMQVVVERLRLAEFYRDEEGCQCLEFRGDGQAPASYNVPPFRFLRWYSDQERPVMVQFWTMMASILA